MTRRVILRPQVKLEIFEAAEWYETQGRGLRAEFLRVLETCLTSIEGNPRLYPKVYGDVRRAALRRFPYGVIYKIDENDIVIIACQHARRDPKSWKDRL